MPAMTPEFINLLSSSLPLYPLHTKTQTTWPPSSTQSVRSATSSSKAARALTLPMRPTIQTPPALPRYENPDDVAAIEHAERTIGDFKLKSDPTYVLPEEQRMTPARKRLQMLALEEALHAAKMDFNGRLLALRTVKARVIDEVRAR
eukprot:46855-Chlamydomonas_euryale.AAC.1